MPANQQPKKLLEISTKKVGEQLYRFSTIALFDRISASKVVDILDKKLRKSWKTFSEIIEERKYPVCLERMVLEKCLAALEQTKKTIRIGRETDDKLFIAQHYLCLSSTREWSFWLRKHQKKSIEFMAKFNTNVTELKISCGLKHNELLGVLNKTQNITTLHISRGKKWYCKSIGASCHKLQKLIIDEKYISKEDAEMICFQDFPSRTVKNAICKTLQYFEAWISKEGIFRLLENMKKLQTIKRENIVNYGDILTASKASYKGIYPCALEHLSITADDGNFNFQEVFQNFPNLTSLDICCPENQSIPHIFNLHRLMVRCCNVNLELTADLLENFNIPWSNLRHLALDFQKYTTIDFSMVSRSCPNLEVLYVGNCEQKRDKMFYPFRKVDKLLMSTEVDIKQCTLLGCMSHVLKTFGLRRTGVELPQDLNLTDDLLTFSFPCLEYLEYSPNTFAAKENVLKLLYACPALTHLGLTIDKNLSNIVRIMTSHDHWNLTVAPEHEFLIDLFKE